MIEAQVFNEEEARDVIALEWLLNRETKDYTFPKKAEAARFILTCLGAIPYKLGADPQGIPANMLEEFLKSFGIIIERKTYPIPQDKWRNGYYIYRNGELKFFVSDPQRGVSSQQGGTIKIDNPVWTVKTNYKA